MAALLTTLTVLLPLVTLMVAPPKYLPDYQRGGWGKYAR
jgi:hypothetical protein